MSIASARARPVCALGEGGYVWCVSSLTVDPAALARGVFAVHSLDVVLRDGRSVLSRDGSALSIDWPNDLAAETIFLRLAAGSRESGSDDPPGAGAVVSICLARDIGSDPSAFPIARVLRPIPGGPLAIDEAFAAPTCAVHLRRGLVDLLAEACSLVMARAQTLAATLGTASHGVSEISDFLQLSILNASGLELNHLARLPTLHPERLHLALARLAAELQTFAGADRLAHDIPSYDHDEPVVALHGVLERLRRCLVVASRPSAIALKVEERKYGVRIVFLDGVTDAANALIVLEAQSSLPPESLRARLPQQIKIGPADRIRDLVNQQLPGIEVSALPLVPRALPLHAASSYFRIESASSDLWGAVVEAGMFTLHVAGDFPQLVMTLWAVDRAT